MASSTKNSWFIFLHLKRTTLYLLDCPFGAAAFLRRAGHSLEICPYALQLKQTFRGLVDPTDLAAGCCLVSKLSAFNFVIVALAALNHFAVNWQCLYSLVVPAVACSVQNNRINPR